MILIPEILGRMTPNHQATELEERNGFSTLLIFFAVFFGHVVGTC